MPDEIRVLVADDSGLMRLIISDILNAENDIKVIGTAKDGKEAVSKSLELEPDVLVLDMYMGDFDGTYTVKKLLPKKHIPILILSSMGNTNLDPILEALHLGAFDYINKPKDKQSKVREIGEQLIKKVREAKKSGERKVKKVKTILNQNHHTFYGKSNYDIIVIGASTGGPTAVETVIKNLPKNLPVPVLVAQHMPANFVPSFVKRLDTITPLKVQMGRKGEVLQPGTVTIAPGSRNMVIRRENQDVVVDFISKKFKEYNYPSINALFLSVAEVYKNKAVSVVLTGMGKDGADGSCAIKEAGGYTVAQNKETSAVYGMPRAVVERGGACNVVPLNEISGFLVSCLA
jgi:two-component system, chemotaxis family, protein-glutamate methylesterase/glutaminase